MHPRLARFDTQQGVAIAVNAEQVLYIADRDDGHVFIHFEADNMVLVKGTLEGVEKALNEAGTH